MNNSINRRDFLKFTSGLAVAGMLPVTLQAASQLPKRLIPGTSELLPVIGLGSTKPVMQIPETGTGPLYDVIQALVEFGGSVIDTAPRSGEIDSEFGKVLQDPRWQGRLFVSTKVTTTGKQEGLEQLKLTQKLFGLQPADLVQVQSMVDNNTHWPTLKQWKEAGGTRYIGVTVSNNDNHAQIESFMKMESPDFVQINYSVAESEAEQRLLPMAEDLGIAVQINRPFMNGSYFEKTRDLALPDWAAEFDCRSWAQFSLKYILAHNAVTCILTETTKAEHMHDNLQAAFGRLPDAAMKKRMRDLIINL